MTDTRTSVPLQASTVQQQHQRTLTRHDLVSGMSRETALVRQPERRVRPALFVHASGESYIGFVSCDGYFIVSDFDVFDMTGPTFSLVGRRAHPVSSGSVFRIKQSRDGRFDFTRIQKLAPAK